MRIKAEYPPPSKKTNCQTVRLTDSCFLPSQSLSLRLASWSSAKISEAMTSGSAEEMRWDNYPTTGGTSIAHVAKKQ